jgi:flagellin
MSLFVQTNVNSLVAQQNFSATHAKLSKTMQQLSSGYKINSASDDAAGVGIASRLSAAVAAYGTAQQNANNATSMVQTADGGAAQISDILTRLSQLAVEGSNGTLNTSDSANLQQEFAAQVAEINNIAQNTTFNGVSLLAGTAAATTFQVGITSAASSQISVTFGGADAGASGVNVGLSLSSVSVSTAAAAQSAITSVSAAVTALAGVRAGFGSSLNALADRISNLSQMATNTAAALSQIQDVDVAAATSKLAQQQVQSQAGEAILAQANQQAQLAVSLIHGQ